MCAQVTFDGHAFFLQALDTATEVKISAKKLKKVSQKFQVEIDGVDPKQAALAQLLKYKPHVAVSLVIHLLQKQYAANIKERDEMLGKAMEEEKKVMEEQNKKKPKSAAKQVSTGYNFNNWEAGAAMTNRMIVKLREINRKSDSSLLRNLDLLLQMLQQDKLHDGAAYSAVNNSFLNGMCAEVLRQLTIADAGDRAELLDRILNLLEVCSKNCNLVPLLRPRKFVRARMDNQFDLVELLGGLVSQAKIYKGQEEEENAAQKGAVANIISKGQVILKQVDDIVCKLNAELGSREDDSKYSDEEKKVEEDVSGKVFEWMRGKQFEVCDLSKEPFKFSAEVQQTANAAVDKKRILRIRKELAILSNSLPDGIFVRVNEDRMDIIKVLILGPGDTPYENGCFIFDLYLPPEFPNKPPKMRLRTTGVGYRFNPNLYTDGYVCLSLLGTWQGPGWEPETSTLLQLLVSLQAMVFCEEPYTNEPGWYASKQSEESRHYNKQLRQATALYAMLWHYTKNNDNPWFFTPLINAHFFARRDQILKQLDNWEKLNAELSENKYCYSSEMTLDTPWEETKKQLTQKLRELECPKMEE